MKKFWILSLICVLVLTAASLLPQKTSGQKEDKFKQSENGIPNRYIVILSDKYVDRSATAPTVENEAAFLSSVYGADVRNVYFSSIKGFSAEMSDEDARAMSEDDRVAFVEQDAEIFLAADQANAPWGLDRMDQRAIPLNTNYTYEGTGSGVHAYILDTGIRPTHNEFGGRASIAFDAVGDGQNGFDCNGHGTHVAGIIGAATYGVAKNVRLHGVRVMPCSGTGQISQIIAGIDWVTANRVNPAVANISITSSGISPSFDLSVTNSIASGVTYTIAAGNTNLNACNYSPARTPNAITVGATTNIDSKATYSNWGTCLDIWAPGHGIISVSNANDTDSRVLSGTSMAAPAVAGVAAVFLGNNPAASPATVAQAISGASTAGPFQGLMYRRPTGFFIVG